MRLEEIRDLVLSADPKAQHYERAYGDASYTVWEETKRLSQTADDVHEKGWKFYVHRYALEEFDEIAKRIEAALDADARVAYRYTVDYEQDTGIIHHIFECEGI